MADTTILKYKVESWIRDTWLPKQPEFSGIKFTSCNLPLATGGEFKGEFEFDAVDFLPFAFPLGGKTIA